MVDVVVVGGGPAGCSAALTLMAAGHSVTVVSTPRATKKPMETAVPQLRHLLRSIGAEEVLTACEPCHGIESAWEQPRPFLISSILNPYGHAWFIHRETFDATLRRLAIKAGSVWLEAEVSDAIFGPDRVTAFTNGEEITAHSALLATGSLAWTARVTGQTPGRLDALICYWARFDAQLTSRLLHVETSANGWWYVCPGGISTVDVCFVTDSAVVRACDPGNANNWNVEFQKTAISRDLSLQMSAKEINVAPLMIGSLPTRCGPSWAAAGDSAIRLDPIASSGTATALNSGVRAARTLIDSWRGNAKSAVEYCRWGYDLWEKFATQRQQRYAALALRYPEGFWHRRVSVITIEKDSRVEIAPPYERRLRKRSVPTP